MVDRGAIGLYQAHLLVRGVRHVEDAELIIPILPVNAELRAVPEPTNPANPEARQLLWGDHKLGYVADYLLDDVTALEAAAVLPRFFVAQVNLPPDPAHHRLLVRVEAEWPEGFESFSGERFKPYGTVSLPLVG